MRTASRPFPAVLLTLAVSASLVWWLRADDTLPKAPPVARYDAMAERSPFTVPTIAAPTPTPPPPTVGPRWWDQMFVTSLMDRGGVYYAAVLDKASSKRYLLEINKADPDSQLLMSSVHWDDRLDQTTVTVSKGAETAPPLKFDATASPVASASMNPYQPGMGSNPQIPFTPPPRNAPINPATLPPGFTGTPPPPPPGVPSVVRRIAPINANPPNGVRNVNQQPSGPPRRIIVPNNADSGD